MILIYLSRVYCAQFLTSEDRLAQSSGEGGSLPRSLEVSRPDPRPNTYSCDPSHATPIHIDDSSLVSVPPTGVLPVRLGEALDEFRFAGTVGGPGFP